MFASASSHGAKWPSALQDECVCFATDVLQLCLSGLILAHLPCLFLKETESSCLQCCFKMKGWDRRRTHCQMLVAISIKNKPFFFVLCCQGIASVCFSTAGLFLFYFCSSGTLFWEFEFITLKAFIICYHCGISIKSVVKPKHTHAHSYTWLNHFKKVFLFTYQSIKNYHTHLFIYACLYVIYFNNYTHAHSYVCNL